MMCPRCRKAVPEGARFCPHCGTPLEVVTGVAPASGESSTLLSPAGEPGVTGGMKPESSGSAGGSTLLSPVGGPGVIPERGPVPPPAPPRPAWQLSREQVDRWVRDEIGLDELLGVQGDEPWEEIRGRWDKINSVANGWEQNPTDADLQRLGQRALQKLAGMRSWAEDEAAFRNHVRRERLKRQVRRYLQRLEEMTRDGVLQVEEWKTLVNEARQEGLGEEALRRIVEEWSKAHPGVLMGVRVGDRRLMTLEEVKELWEKEGRGWVGKVDSRAMEAWLEKCVGDPEGAELWRRGRLAVLMGRFGSQVYWIGPHKVQSLKEWVEGVYRGELEEWSLKLLSVEEGRDELAAWLEEVHHRGDLGRRLREVGESPLRTLWEVVWATGVRPEPEVAYRGTARLVEKDPTFLEAQFHHVLHCARTGRYEEARQWMERLLEAAEREGVLFRYLDRLTGALSAFPKFEQARSVLEKYRGRMAGQPFKFRQGQAKDPLELARMCDRFPEEAASYLRDGLFQQWLGGRGEAPLAQEAKRAVERYGKNPRRALEMFVRAVYRSEGREAEGQPRLRAEPTGVRWEGLPVGAVVQKSIRVLNEGRGTAWGSIRVEGATQDLQWTSAFDEVPVTVDLKLDTARYQPGDYQATLVIEPEGLSPIRVPITWTVVPLDVAVTPSRVEFGYVSGGKVESVIRLECRTPGGRILIDKVQVEPSLPGLQVETSGGEAGPVVRLKWDTEALESGRMYRAHVRIGTNVDTFTVPVSVLRGIPWAEVGFQAAVVGLAVGGLLLIVRLLAFLDVWTWDMPGDFLESLLDPGRWKSSPEEGPYRLGLLGASILVPIGLWLTKKKHKKSGS